MRQATRAQWIKCAIAILLYLVFPHLGAKLVGINRHTFHFRYLYHKENTLVVLEKGQKNPAVRSHELGRCYYLCIGSRLLCQYLYLPKLPDSFFFSREIIAGRRLSICQQNELRPRVPNTPLSMPLAQHTLPIVGTKSYIEWPQWKYKRVPGFGNVKLNDIVVFNFPAGDTVAVNYQPDRQTFYTLAYGEG